MSGRSLAERSVAMLTVLLFVTLPREGAINRFKTKGTWENHHGASLLPTWRTAGNLLIFHSSRWYLPKPMSVSQKAASEGTEADGGHQASCQSTLSSSG